jgi:hypothetical protein
MIRFIEHIVEPERLLLSWQARDGDHVRMRRFVGELVRRGDDADLMYLRESEDFQIARQNGFVEYSGFPASENHTGVQALFMKRLPPRKRTDFGRYLESFRIRPDAVISDFALLGYSGAKLPDDDFTIVHPFDTAVPPFELLTPVQGYRYYQERMPFDRLKLGMDAQFEPEPENPYDPEAMAIVLGGEKCGYVCRGLTGSLHKWLDAHYDVSASIERLNGSPERPLIYLYLTVRNPE